MTEALVTKKELLRDGIITHAAYHQGLRWGYLNPITGRGQGRRVARFRLSEAKQYWLVCKHGIPRSLVKDFHISETDGGILLRRKPPPIDTIPKP